MNINGGFENSGRGWTGGTEWAITDADFRSSGHSARRSATPGALTVMSTQLIACRAGDAIRASAYVKCVGVTGGGRMRVSFWSAEGVELFIISGDYVTFSDWRRSDIVATVPAGMPLMRVEVAADNTAGDVYFDDITFSTSLDAEVPVVSLATPVLPNPQILGRSRVATQYTESTRFLSYLDTLLKPMSNLQSTMILNLIQTDVEQAAGYNLDVLGEIVGVSRIVPRAISLVFFGFFDQISSASYGEEGFLSSGARFREELESAFASTVLQDPEYRILIKSRIIRNHSNGTNESILQALLFLLVIDVIIIDDNGGMEIGVTFGRQLTAAEISMMDDLNILPRPAAVKIRRRSMFLPGRYFGFDGQPGALGFGEETDTEVGGPLAEEF